MKAGALLLALMMCAACASSAPDGGGSPLDRYGGPALPDTENFDRAAFDVTPAFEPSRKQRGQEPDRRQYKKAAAAAPASLFSRTSCA